MTRRTFPPVRQRGLTMAELLVAITLGLFVALAAGSLFASGSWAYLSQTQSAEADEGGRYAIDMVGRAIRQGAWVDWQHADLVALMGNGDPAPLGGLDASAVPRASQGIQDAVANQVNGSDVLAVRFHGAGAPPKGDGSVLDCAGFPVPQNQEGWSIFYVAKSAEGEPELRCKYKGAGGWGADAVIGGVDSFQVLYGVDTDEPPDGVPNRYVNATAVNALDAALVLNGASAAERESDLRRRTYWKRVASVQYALLLRGARGAPAAGKGITYDLFGPAYGLGYGAVDPGTRLREDALSAGALPRERHVHAATVALRGGAR
jgi:type IV pilus assembly protein PilW